MEQEGILNKYTAFNDQEPKVIYQHGLYPSEFLNHVSAVEIDGYRFVKESSLTDYIQDLKELIRDISQECCSQCFALNGCENQDTAISLGVFDE
jgi:hypothetical protein